MLELALLNVALLVGLAALPRRDGVGRWSGRRRARAVLRAGPAAFRSLGAIVLERGRRIGATLWPVFQPELFGALPKAVSRTAIGVPALAALFLLGGGPAALSEVPVADADARACSGSHDHTGGRMTTAPDHERMTTPVLAGFLTET